jgi:ABC-type molybdate transport system substrate-binding protein
MLSAVEASPRSWSRIMSVIAMLALAPAAAQAQKLPPSPAPHIVLFGASNVKGALAEIVRAFTAETGIAVDATYGSSDALREKIEGGAPADLFASADTVNPIKLQREGKGGPADVYARDRMCLLGKTAIVGTRGVIDLLLDPKLRLITATPGSDPAGDAAETIFTKVDSAHFGSKAILDAKALRLIGGKDAVAIPPGADPGEYLLVTVDRGDELLGHCSGFSSSVTVSKGKLKSIEMPQALALRADYGMSLRPNAPPEALKLRDFIMTPASQTMFEKYGFSRV